MTTQNYEPTLDLVKERMAQINGLIESEEEIMTYYDLTGIEKYNKS